MFAKRRILPGFGISLGFTTAYLGLLVLLPIAALIIRAAGLTWEEFVQATLNKRALLAYGLSFGASAAAALVDLAIGLPIAWAITRYRFPGRRAIDALIDLPFALPTAVAGLALTQLYGPNGWFGELLAPLGIQVAFTRLGVTVALAFISLPFVVRTMQPVIEELDAEAEEASASLGATRLTTLRRVIFPALWPAIITSFAMSFARGVGEYGSVVFISGNLPNKTEIAPLLIVTKLEQYDYAGAAAIGVVMLAFSFVFLLTINLLQRRSLRRSGVNA
jgi:sulfate transport system permease protein